MNNQMKLNRYVIAAGVVGALFSCNHSFAIDGNKPNVIVIMTDDQGYGELSIHGNPILKTPNLDLLANQSIRFSDFHVAPMCTPTRGQLMTGIDAVRNGAVNVSSGRSQLRPELPTMADIFKANGYNTGLFGKWHLGDYYPHNPEYRGFSETLWFPASHIGSVPDFWGNDYFDDTYIHNGKMEKYLGYCTDVFFEKAMECIQSSIIENKPFFIYLPTNAPHIPLNAQPEDIATLEKAFEDSPLADKNIKVKDNLIRYLAMIHNIDVNIGKLRNFLKKEGLDKNTILIFLTDNGSTFGSDYYDAGMRGRKTELWEGGHRVPLFISYPNGNFTNPRTVDGLAQVQDILPTLIDICKLKNPFPSDFDGISLAPQLTENISIPEERMFVINFSRMPLNFDYPSPYSQPVIRKEGSAVLWNRWRLLENKELYDLRSDPMQTTNVISQNPDIAQKMIAFLDNWWDKVKLNANEILRTHIGNEHENPILLTSCEWVNVILDQQIKIKSGSHSNSYWLLQVDQPGTYEFELRRWPRELDIPLSESVGTDRKLQISSARIYIDCEGESDLSNKISVVNKNMNLPDEARSAIFTVELDQGPIALHTWFYDKELTPQCGAYYVYVKRKG
jgi:arylsulfatase